MHALIVSKLKKNDFTSKTLKIIKKLNQSFENVCIVLENETDENLLFIERSIKKITLNIKILNVKKVKGEISLLKNGLRYLRTIDEFECYLYTNDKNKMLEVVQLLKSNNGILVTSNTFISYFKPYEKLKNVFYFKDSPF